MFSFFESIILNHHIYNLKSLFFLFSLYLKPFNSNKNRNACQEGIVDKCAKKKTEPVPDKSGKDLMKFHSDFTFATWYILHKLTGTVNQFKEKLMKRYREIDKHAKNFSVTFWNHHQSSTRQYSSPYIRACNCKVGSTVVELHCIQRIRWRPHEIGIIFYPVYIIEPLTRSGKEYQSLLEFPSHMGQNSGSFSTYVDPKALHHHELQSIKFKSTIRILYKL